jgi:hypothetical protein
MSCVELYLRWQESSDHAVDVISEDGYVEDSPFESLCSSCSLWLYFLRAGTTSLATKSTKSTKEDRKTPLRRVRASDGSESYCHPEFLQRTNVIRPTLDQNAKVIFEQRLGREAQPSAVYTKLSAKMFGYALRKSVRKLPFCQPASSYFRGRFSRT